MVPQCLQGRRSRVGLLLEFALFAASLSSNGSVAAQTRIVALWYSMVGALVIFAAVVLAVAAVAQKEPLCELRGVIGD
jgi:hypothetical protein